MKNLAIIFAVAVLLSVFSTSCVSTSGMHRVSYTKKVKSGSALASKNYKFKNKKHDSFCGKNGCLAIQR